MTRPVVSSRTEYSHPNVVAFGDSFTAMGDGWFDYMMPKYFPSATAINLGISGSAIFQRLPSIKECWDNDPAILVIEFGLNDQWLSGDVNLFQTNMTNAVQWSQQNTNAKIVIPDLIYYSATNYSTDRETLYAPWRTALQTVASNTGVLFVDWHTDFYNFWNANGDSVSYSAYDNVHPSSAGFGAIGDAMYNALVSAGYDRYLTANPQNRPPLKVTRSEVANRTEV